MWIVPKSILLNLLSCIYFCLQTVFELFNASVYTVTNNGTFIFFFPSITSFSKVGIWNPTFQNLETFFNPVFLKIRFQMVWFLKVQAVAMVPTIWKLDHSKSRWFCPDIKYFLTKLLPCLNFKWSGFWISDPLWNLDNLKHSKSRGIWISDPHCTWNWSWTRVKEIQRTLLSSIFCTFTR